MSELADPIARAAQIRGGCLGLCLLWAVTACGARSAEPPAAGLPKYASFAVPLARDHAYLSQAPAPDFWTLSPYYVGQQSDAACSLASLSMLVNAARRGAPLDAEEPLVTQPLLLQRVDSDAWAKGVAKGGDGVTLDELAVLAKQSLAAFGMTARRVEVTHLPAATPDALDRLRELLRQNEASAYDWVFFNFRASDFVGVGDYGHIAPVGAYDEAQRRVLVMDPDREWYEPYWIPDEVALGGMATPDSVTQRPRGYLYVSLCNATGCGP